MNNQRSQEPRRRARDSKNTRHLRGKKIAGILVGVLLIGIVSAGLVNYISNSVSGSVEVGGPVFYATTSPGNPGSLTINEFEGNGYTYTISGQSERIFMTNELEEMDFYAPELKLSVEARLYNGTQPKLLDLEFGYYYKFVNGITYPFCKVTINVTSDNLEIYSDICNGSPANSLEAFYYSIKGRGTGDVQIKVKTSDENTKVEVLGVVDLGGGDSI